MRGDLNWIADQLDAEAKHWRERPDYFTLKREAFPEAWSYKDGLDHVRGWLADRADQQRGTHTDIVLRELAAMLRRIAAEQKPLDKASE